jgi:hypothetical protein
MPRSLRKITKQLVRQAYAREQGKALESLDREFDRWKSGDIDCWELTELIHRFHNGESRELYTLYEAGDIKMVLARAIALDIISAEDVPATLLESMQPTIEFFRGELAKDEQHPEPSSHQEP